MFQTINLSELHKMIVIILILCILFCLIRRKHDNRLLCEGFKLIFLFFIVTLAIIAINLFGETVGMKVITI